MHLKSGPYEANIKGMDAEEFPIIPQIPDKPTTRMSQATLRRMIGEVAFVAATDDSRPVLTGVLTTFSDDLVTMAAADPYRLSVRHARLLDRVDPAIEVIIPAKSLFEVARILEDTDEATVDILVTPNKSQIIFHTDEADLVSRIIEGQFPNYGKSSRRATRPVCWRNAKSCSRPPGWRRTSRATRRTCCVSRWIPPMNRRS